MTRRHIPKFSLPLIILIVIQYLIDEAFFPLIKLLDAGLTLRFYDLANVLALLFKELRQLRVH